jgi:transposase
LFSFIIEVKQNAVHIVVNMNKFHKETLKVRLLKLALLRSTGAPSDLAKRFEVSERSIKRIVREIKEDGTEIRYSQVRESYVTGEDF